MNRVDIQAPSTTWLQSMAMVDEAMAEILRQKTPADRLAIANGMWRFARDMIRANIRRDHSDWTDDEVDRAVARRLSHGAI